MFKANQLVVPQEISMVRTKAGSKEKLGAAFLSENPANRIKAIRSMNAAAKEYGDTLVKFARNRTMNLSSFADTPTSIGQNTPGAIVFGDADREIVDIRWSLLYRFQDNRGIPNDTFIIEDVFNAIEFEELAPGSPVKISHVETARNRFEYRTVAGGFQYEIYWAEDYPYWSIADGMAAMNTKHALKQERIAIETMTAAGGIAVSYQSGSTALDQDVSTINEGQRAILNALYTANRPDGQDTEEKVARPVFFLLYNEFGASMTERVNKALAAAFNTPNDVLGGRAVNHPVIPFASPYVTGTDWHLVLPGRKNVFAMKNDLRVLSSFDPYAAGGVDARIGHARMGCVRADANQVATLATS